MYGVDEADPLEPRLSQDFEHREHGRGGGDAGRMRDRRTKITVAIEAEPARRRSVPADRVDLSVAEERGGAQHRLARELVGRFGPERDFGDAKATEVKGDFRRRAQHLGADRLEDGVRRRRQHPDPHPSLGRDVVGEAGRLRSRMNHLSSPRISTSRFMASITLRAVARM